MSNNTSLWAGLRWPIKAIIIAIPILAIGWAASNFGLIPASNAKSGSSKIFTKSDKVYTVGVNTYAGFTPIIWLNGGLEPNDKSILHTEYGIDLKIKIFDDFIAGRNAFKEGSVDILYCTADALPTEMSTGSDMIGAKHFILENWSRGADAIVVAKNVQTVADLKGKKIAVAEGTASHSLLINTLETNGIDPHAITMVKVESGIDAAQMFKAGQVDACVTWSPDDADCVAAVKGSKVLVSTKTASNLICDGLIAKQSFLDGHQEGVKKFVSAVLYANSVMNSNPQEVKKAATEFAKAFGTDDQFCIDGCKNIQFATLADNANFYGLNSNYTGVTGDFIYTKMGRTYSSLGLCKNVVPWLKASDSSIIESLISEGTVKGDQSAEKAKAFTAPTEEMKTSAAISDKKVTIEYPVGSDLLDNNARAIIDREFVGIAKQFSSARIRIEGNTDNTGNQSTNIVLSRRRAQAVANYLTSEYGFDKNRFVIVGNGSKHAIADGVVGSNQSYRNTDFQLISE